MVNATRSPSRNSRGATGLLRAALVAAALVLPAAAEASMAVATADARVDLLEQQRSVFAVVSVASPQGLRLDGDLFLTVNGHATRVIPVSAVAVGLMPIWVAKGDGSAVIVTVQFVGQVTTPNGNVQVIKASDSAFLVGATPGLARPAGSLGQPPTRMPGRTTP